MTAILFLFERYYQFCLRIPDYVYTRPVNHGRCLKALTCLVTLLSLSPPSFSQSHSVQGTVTGENKETLIGVSVKVKNTGIGVSTDVNGKFVMNVPSGESVLVFSYIGYQAAEVTVGNQKTIDVSLKPVDNNLSEVVIIGYGTVQKKDLTGSVAQVAMEDVSKAPVFSIQESLAGRLAGVQVSSSDGQPGSDVNIIVRGANSITQDNSPLYVVDGFPVEGFNLNVFNPHDIASIEVLKDASSPAIYGARGANGVVIITTKKGQEGSPKTSFTSTHTFNKNIRTMDLLSAYEFLEYNLERDPSAGSETVKSPTYLYLTTPNKTLADYMNYQGTDVQDEFFRTGSLRNYSVAVRGGTKQTKYSVSGSVDNQEGTIINTSYDRYQGRLTLDQDLGKRFRAGVNANYAYLLQGGNGTSVSSNSATQNVLYSVWGFNPLTGFDADVELDPTTASSNDYKFNPVMNQQNLVRDIETNNLNVNTYLNFSITPELSLRVTGILNNSSVNNENFNNSRTLYGSPLTVGGQNNGVNGNISLSKVNNWANENTLTWNKRFKNRHSLNAVAGFTLQGNKSSVRGFGATFLPNESLGVDGLEEGTFNASLTRSSSSLWNAASFLSRVAYNYQSKYYLTLSARADGSSKFAEKNHWGYFPSAAVAWRFTEEKPFKNTTLISDGKLRFSYGRTGNNRVGDFSYLSITGLPVSNTYSFANNYVSSIVPLSIGNPDLKWETTEQFDAGLDLSLLKNRINIVADVYKKTTKDLLLNATLPASTGYGSAFQNVGSVENRGLELTLNTVNIRKRDFTWQSSFNISFNRSKVLALANNQDFLLSSVRWHSSWYTIPAYIAKIGEPLGLMYGYIWDGVYQYDDFNQTPAGTYVLKDEIPTNGNTRTSIKPGDIKYSDLNGDKIVSAADYTVIGNSLPLHIGGFNNNFTYRGFDLNLFFQWSYGNKIQNTNRLVFEGNGINNPYLQQFASFADRWTPENPSNTMFRTNGYFGGGYSSRTIEDGSYLRLKTVSLGYNLPKELLKKIRMSSARIYTSAQNLWTWTKYSGLDPEVSTYNSVLTGGFDYSAYPRPYTVAFGVDVTF